VGPVKQHICSSIDRPISKVKDTPPLKEFVGFILDNVLPPTSSFEKSPKIIRVFEVIMPGVIP
jgi:hypothetical protein